MRALQVCGVPQSRCLVSNSQCRVYRCKGVRTLALTSCVSFRPILEAFFDYVHRSERVLARGVLFSLPACPLPLLDLSLSPPSLSVCLSLSPPLFCPPLFTDAANLA
jgi:hypothetical protein